MAHVPGLHIPEKRLTGFACASLLTILFLVSCGTKLTTEPVVSTTTTFPSETPFPTTTDLPPTPPPPSPTVPTPTPTALPADFWQTLPVIPTEISARVRALYAEGLEMGNDPQVFSRIGDCASAAPAFLTGFYDDYNLGSYTYLQPAVDYFHDSFKRPSVAARAGLNTSGVLTTLWTDPTCLSKETLLDCQYRIDHPGFAIIALGTNESYYVHHDPGIFERNLRTIIEATIARGIVPILATKADNLEGDNSINATVATLAMEYDIPLWNFWLSVQDLPDKGLLETEHLTTISYVHYTDFSLPHSLEYGAQMRNLSALQMLYFLWEQLALSPTPTP